MLREIARALTALAGIAAWSLLAVVLAGCEIARGFNGAAP